MQVFILVHLVSYYEIRTWNREIQHLVKHVHPNVVIRGLTISFEMEKSLPGKHFTWSLTRGKYTTESVIGMTTGHVMRELGRVGHMDVFYYYGHFNSMFIGVSSSKTSIKPIEPIILADDLAKLVRKMSPKLIILDACYSTTIEMVYLFRKCSAILIGYIGYTKYVSTILGDLFGKPFTTYKQAAKNIITRVNKKHQSRNGKLVAIDIVASRKPIAAIRKLYLAKKLVFCHQCLINSHDPYYYSLCCILKYNKIPSTLVDSLERSIVASTDHRKIGHLGIRGYRHKPIYKPYLEMLDWYG
jgi:hypothetical protein